MAGPMLAVAQAAIRAAQKVGAATRVVVRRTGTATEYDVTTGRTSQVPTDYSWLVLVTEYAPRLVDGETILATDRRVLGAARALGFAPDPETDVLLIDGVPHTIVSVSHDPAGATYDLQVRR